MANINMKSEPNFDVNPTQKELVAQFVCEFFRRSRTSDRYKRDENERIWRMYKLQENMTGRDKNRSNLYIPKLYGLIETVTPVIVDSLFGVRPFIPIELQQQRDSEIGGAITQLLDEFLHDSDFFEEAVRWVKSTLTFGVGFLESRPLFKNMKVKEFQPEIAVGLDGQPQIIDIKKVVIDKVMFGLKIKSFAPWDIYRDWNADNLNNSRGLIKFRGLVSKRKIREMAKNGNFGDNFDVDRLDAKSTSSAPDPEHDNWGKKMAESIGVGVAEQDDDLGIMLSYESEGRYIDSWNLTTVLRDIDNPYEHGGINLTRSVNTPDTNDYVGWYGIGEGKPVEALCHALNDNWRQSFDNHQLMQHKVIVFDDEAINVDQLAMIAGNRIPVTPTLGKGLGDAFAEIEIQPLTSDFYNIPGVIDGMIDETAGVHDPTRGEEGRRKTAREAILLKSAGESRIKLKIKMAEQMGLKGFGEKTLSIIEQFAQPDDIISKIGTEKASLIPTVNPQLIDGGFEFAFKGSGRVAEQIVKRQDAKDVYQLMVGNPTVRQDELADWLLSQFEMSDEKRRKFIIPDEVIQQMMAMQEQAQQQGGAESTRSVSNGSVIGGSGGNKVTGRDNNEKLGLGA